MVSRAMPTRFGVTEGTESGARHLLLYLARSTYPQKNAIAATLAWATHRAGWAFEVYYDAYHTGRHYGGGGHGIDGPAALTGGLVAGSRHIEALTLALQRFNTMVATSGQVAFSSALASLGVSEGQRLYCCAEEDVVGLYETLLSRLGVEWPVTAVMLNSNPGPTLAGVDAYCYPEIIYRGALGIESTASDVTLVSLRARGVHTILTCGVPAERQERIAELGFETRDLGIITPGDDYAAVTSRLTDRWKEHRRGWMIGDPVLVASWLPTACREDRAAIFSVPQSRIVERLKDEIAATSLPVLGRQFEDEDFFLLSRLGQSFQLIDPNRPPLPTVYSTPVSWASPQEDPSAHDPSDEQLRAWAGERRVLTSLVFWTGMIRETENLYALMDLLALTGLKAGIALTIQSMTWRPSPLDLLTVPCDQGGVFPNTEILLASCGTGAAIESLLPPGALATHLGQALDMMKRQGLPKELRPQGWWATMDASMIEKTGRLVPIRRRPSPPYIQLRFQPRSHAEVNGEALDDLTGGNRARGRRALRSSMRHARRLIRDSSLSSLFEAYRPYEHFKPGEIRQDIPAAVKQAGLSYMLSKSRFGAPPQIVWAQDQFVALNYTAGQWDGWTPFETINDVHDLRQAESVLLRRNQPGWLLGGIDTCLWAFSGELWKRAPGLAAIASCVASGGASGRLINVPPRVIARYARIIS